MTAGFMLTPIGRVVSNHKVRAELPVEGSAATLTIFPEYAPALEGITRSSHLIVLGYMHEADRSVLRARPRKHDPQAPEAGVFATRSPARPNPLALTVVPLLQVRKLSVEVTRLDFVDGTPIVDLKPYCPGWDSVYAATRAHRTPVARMDDTRLDTILLRDLENHLGSAANASWAVAFRNAMLMAIRTLGVDPRDPELCFTLSGADVTLDAVMGISGASFANGRLLVASSPGVLQLTLATPRQTLMLQRDDATATFRVVAETRKEP